MAEIRLANGRVLEEEQWVAEVNASVDLVGRLIVLYGGRPSTAHLVAAEFYRGLGL